MTIKVKIIGRGTYYRDVANETNENVSTGPDPNLPDVTVNWGLSGAKYHSAIRVLRNIPVLNKPIGLNKYSVVKKAEEIDVPVPETISANRAYIHNLSHYLFKPLSSLGGRNITMATDRPPNISGYYQKFIPGRDRRYELRVHGATWLDQSEWLVQKRVNDNRDAITWNHHTGGRFITVNNPNNFRIFKEAKKYTKMILDKLGLQFGGADFIVTNDGKIFFLEINTSLGFTMPRTKQYWVDAINKLTTLNLDDIRQLLERRVSHEDFVQESQLDRTIDHNLDQSFERLLNRQSIPRGIPPEPIQREPELIEAKIYFDDLKRSAKDRILRQFRTQENRENWNTQPLFILERRV